MIFYEIMWVIGPIGEVELVQISLELPTSERFLSEAKRVSIEYQ